jgi:single-strand DNA-binding protein
MAASLNRVFLIGNLTRDPELRYVPSGTAVATFDIAVNRFYTSQSGEKKEETSFFRIVVWSRRAEVCAEYLTKGSPVLVDGRLRSRSWQTQDGQKRNTVEVVAQNVQFLRASPKRADSPPDKRGAGDSPEKEEVESIDLNNTNSKEASGEIPF